MTEETRSNISIWQRRFDRKLLDLEFHFSAGPLRVVPIPNHWELLRRKFTTCLPLPSKKGEMCFNLDQIYQRKFASCVKDDERSVSSSSKIAAVSKDRTAGNETMGNSVPKAIAPPPPPPLLPPRPQVRSLQAAKARDIYITKKSPTPADDDVNSSFTATTLEGHTPQPPTPIVSRHSMARPKSAAQPRAPAADGVTATKKLRPGSAVSQRLDGLQGQLAKERSQRAVMEAEISQVSRNLMMIRKALRIDV